MSNPYKWRAIAHNRKKAEYTDDSPRLMDAKYAGTCEHCRGPIRQWTRMYYSYASKKCWHLDCYDKIAAERNAAAASTVIAVPLQRTSRGPEPSDELFETTCKRSTACATCGNTIYYGDQMLINPGMLDTYHPGCKPTDEPNIDLLSEQIREVIEPQAHEHHAHIEITEPEPTPQREPEPEQPTHLPATQSRPPWTRLEYRSGTVNITAYSDGIITHDGKAVFLSILGTDSTVKGIGAAFLNQKPSAASKHYYSWSDGLFYEDHRGDMRPLIKLPDSEGRYERKTTKLGNGTQQIIALANFFPDGPNMEVDHRYLLYKPDGTEQAKIFSHIIEQTPTPYLPQWESEIITGLKCNAKLYNNNPHAYQSSARLEILEPEIGPFHAARIRATEKGMDALITGLVEQRIIEF